MNSVFIGLTLIVVVATIVKGSNYKFLAVECRDSDNKTFETEFCAVHGNRGDALITIKRPLNTINVLVGFHKFEKIAYRQIFKVTRISWCSLMAGTTKSNYMINFITSTIKDSAADVLFHKCPYEGLINITNIVFKNDKLLSIYPNGKYRLDVKLFDEQQVEVFYVAVQMELTQN